MNDPRDIERINPQNAPFDTNVNTVPVEGEATGESPVKGAVVKQVPEAAEQQFPGKGEGSNRRAGGKDAA